MKWGVFLQACSGACVRIPVAGSRAGCRARGLAAEPGLVSQERPLSWFQAKGSSLFSSQREQGGDWELLYLHPPPPPAPRSFHARATAVHWGFLASARGAFVQGWLFLHSPAFPVSDVRLVSSASYTLARVCRWEACWWGALHWLCTLDGWCSLIWLHRKPSWLDHYLLIFELSNGWVIWSKLSGFLAPSFCTRRFMSRKEEFGSPRLLARCLFGGVHQHEQTRLLPAISHGSASEL